jgi:DNA replication licensing factor MCM5
MLRELQAQLINHLVVIPGIITSMGKSLIKATKLVVKCTNCGHEKILMSKPGMGAPPVPRICDNQRNPGAEKQNCKLDSYIVVPGACEYMDQQYLRIQEAPEHIPTGEMPRSFTMTVDRYLTDQVQPGVRVKVVGIFQVMSNTSDSSGANK